MTHKNEIINNSTRTNSTRRTFLQTSALGAAGLSLAAGMPASSYARILGANDRVRVGIVGYSGRARGSLIPSFLNHTESKNFELVGVSDIWNQRREQGVAELSEQCGHKVNEYRNNDELYSSGDCDAVIISTADFQHALHTVQAVEAGCDAYVEKPFANTMADARLALKTVETSDRIIAIGTQRRSARNYHLADRFINSGDFGDICMVEMSWNVNQPGRWRRIDQWKDLTENDVDWNRFIMNRPWEPFDARKFREYRLFWPYSSGIPDQWMVHQIDTIHWFTRLPRPRSVVANGGIYMWNDGRENFDTMTAVFDYGPLDDLSKGFQVVYSSRQTNSAGGTREIYYSNGGTLDLSTNTVTPEGGLTERRASAMDMKPFLLEEMQLMEAMQIETAADTGVDNATEANMVNWMDSVRERTRPNADIMAGYSHSVALCMTIAALHTGQRITFDDKKQDVVVG